MQPKPPQPLATFLVCREIFQDRATGEHILIGPTHGFGVPACPSVVRIGLFIKMTGGHGVYRLNIQLHDSEGNMIGEIPGAEEVPMPDPLQHMQIAWRDIVIIPPKPGRYELVLQANKEDVAHDILDIVLFPAGSLPPARPT